MKSYGQIIYEAYAKEYKLERGWNDLPRTMQEEWDRVGQEVAYQLGHALQDGKHIEDDEDG